MIFFRSENGISPSKGQPNATATAPLHTIPAREAASALSSISSRERSIERFRFLRLWLSLADRKNTISSTRSEEHTSELPSLMRISYAVFCLKKKKTTQNQ